ncbi:hypothetical protein [Schlesneria sp. T3-172]|uniref:hypothetical protein n=1 Tax=Schlesneria sphaerica TaxID=3373610 RepID=UPI0037C7A019
MSVPAGGPATINGILYQMLWSLLRAVRLYTLDCDKDSKSGSIQRALLVLEPLRGGGDLQQVRGPARIVEQLKARSDEGTWSLREIIEEVLPDLYLAYDSSKPETEYRFVTEGRMGGWTDVLTFFRGLKKRTPPTGDVLSGLDNKRQLKFRGGSTAPVSPPPPGTVPPKPFWDQPHYTERSLFEKIVSEVRKRKAVQDRETEESTRLGVWHLLANFSIDPGQSIEQVQKEVDSLLLALVDSDVSLREKRGAMLSRLAEQAALGGALIEAESFLREFGINSVPLTNWARLRMNARRNLDSLLQRRGYESSEDVRTERGKKLLSEWQPQVPLLAFAGESGEGKSWLLSTLARLSASEQQLVVLVSGSGDAERDCKNAADAFWRHIKGNDQSLPLDRIAARRRELFHDRVDNWLTLFIDDVQSSQEVRHLVMQPWEEWGIRLAISCSPPVARTFQQLADKRGKVIQVGDFTVQELRTYLTLRLGDGGGEIPYDVLSTLRRPLLSRLYCDIAKPGTWKSINEYGLYERYWLRLFENEQGESPLDAVPLRKLALSTARGAPYPWTGEQLSAVGLDNCAIQRLSRVGWLQLAGTDRYRVWHDRLLNWAAAEALVSQFDAGLISAEDLTAEIKRIFISSGGGGAVTFGYVPMDVLWLLSAPDRSASAVVDHIIEAMENGP